MGFHVKLEDTTKSVTEPGGEIAIEILEKRLVNIEKYGNSADDNGRV